MRTLRRAVFGIFGVLGGFLTLRWGFLGWWKYRTWQYKRARIRDRIWRDIEHR